MKPYLLKRAIAADLAELFGFLNPLFNAYFIVIQAGLTFNYGEFAIIKIRIINTFPDAQEFNGISVSKPIGNKKNALLIAIANDYFLKLSFDPAVSRGAIK